MTVQDLVREALEEIGFDSPFDQQAGSDYDKGLRVFNRMMDTFNAEGLMIFNVSEETFTLPASVSSRTIGPTGQFVTTRPVRVESAALVNTSVTPNLRRPLGVVEREVWESLVIRDFDSIPSIVYYEPTVTNGTLHFDTRSDGTYASLVLSLLQQFTQAAGLSTTLNLPPGYYECCLYNLARRLCRPFGQTPDADLLDQVRQSKERVKDLNREPPARISTAPFTSPNADYGSMSPDDFATRNF